MIDREKVIRGLECCMVGDEHSPKCEICPYATMGDDTCQTMDALFSDALALLKEQEPVEPVFNAMVETDMSYWVCGACGAFIYGNAYPHMAKDTMPKYCGYCGKAVKWE